MSLGPIATGPPARAPLDVASLRDRLEGMEGRVQALQANRQSVGPKQNQQNVPLHALANAAPMGAVADGQSPVFDGATGQFTPGGPLFKFTAPLAGAAPTGPFVWSIATGLYTAASAGGFIQVPFLDKNGAPIPFANGLFGIEVCVGNASVQVISCGISTSGYQLSGVQVDFFSVSGPVPDGTICTCDYTAYGW